MCSLLLKSKQIKAAQLGWGRGVGLRNKIQYLATIESRCRASIDSGLRAPMWPGWIASWETASTFSVGSFSFLLFRGEGLLRVARKHPFGAAAPTEQLCPVAK